MSRMPKLLGKMRAILGANLSPEEDESLHLGYEGDEFTFATTDQGAGFLECEDCVLKITRRSSGRGCKVTVFNANTKKSWDAGKEVLKLTPIARPLPLLAKEI